MRKHRIIYKILLLLYVLLVAYLCFWRFSSMPDVPATFWGIPTDKWVHFFMFLPFIPLWTAAFNWHTDGRWRSVVLLVGLFVFGSILAGAIEILQGVLTTYRSADRLDLIADMIGLAVGGLIGLIVDICKHNRKS